MSKGDIILTLFPYTDLTGNKLRPALILAENEFDVTTAFITTKLQWQTSTDILLRPLSSNGIKKISLIRLSKLATVKKSLVIGSIGYLNDEEIIELNTKLKVIFQLP